MDNLASLIIPIKVVKAGLLELIVRVYSSSFREEISPTLCLDGYGTFLVFSLDLYTKKGVTISFDLFGNYSTADWVKVII